MGRASQPIPSVLGFLDFWTLRTWALTLYKIPVVLGFLDFRTPGTWALPLYPFNSLLNSLISMLQYVDPASQPVHSVLGFQTPET